MALLMSIGNPGGTIWDQCPYSFPDADMLFVLRSFKEWPSAVAGLWASPQSVWTLSSPSLYSTLSE